MGFFEDLKARVGKKAFRWKDCWPEQWQEILKYLVTEQGLDYGALPKGY